LLSQKPGFATLNVSDTGEGIPPESVGRVFDRFYQVDKARQRYGEKRGSGLGLSICQSIINVHRGTIGVTSELGKGTTFTISLPLIGTT
jgi:signal transduction histidine kinase